MEIVHSFRTPAVHNLTVTPSFYTKSSLNSLLGFSRTYNWPISTNKLLTMLTYSRHSKVTKENALLIFLVPFWSASGKPLCCSLHFMFKHNFEIHPHTHTRQSSNIYFNKSKYKYFENLSNFAFPKLWKLCNLYPPVPSSSRILILH